MPRQPRKESKSGIFHIIQRGINRQNIFLDDADKEMYVERLMRYRKESEFELYAYCLMENHIHLLIKEGNEPVSDTIKRIGISYVRWYNKKYDRIGHLFQDRFKSEPVEDDKYMLTVARYIHQNPVKVGSSIDSWTSYESYLYSTDTIDKRLILEMFSANIDEAKKLFTKFMNENTIDTCLDIFENGKLNDKEAAEIIKNTGRVSTCQELQYLSKAKRDEIIRDVKEAGISIQQIARVTGLNRGVVFGA